MALITPLIGATVSGKIGGLVFSHNAGGPYIRILTTPTNPNTPQQVVVRAAIGQLTDRWNNVLTIAQRGGWDVYAFNTKLTNRIGAQVNVSGLAMYIRGNVIRIQGNQAIVDDAPTVFNLGAHSPVLITAFSEATQTGQLEFNTGIPEDLWSSEAGGFMFIFLSRPQNPSINFFRGPYRQSGGVSGDPVPPVSPAAIVAPFAFVAGQKLFGRVVSVRADGRTSMPSFVGVTAIA